jgi:hypothetical protein
VFLLRPDFTGGQIPQEEGGEPRKVSLIFVEEIVKHSMITTCGAVLASLCVLVSPALAKKGDRVAVGTVSAISDSSITVGSLTCGITGDTELEDKRGNDLALADLKLGAVVKMKCRAGNAQEIELRFQSLASPRPNAKLRAILTAETGSTVKSRADYRARTHREKSRGRLQMSASVPLPSTLPAATNANVRALVLKVNVLRADVATAQCTLRFGNKSKASNSVKAIFRLDVEEKNLQLKNRKGICDVDLATEGVQAGVPEIAAGDKLVLIEQVDALTANTVAQGLAQPIVSED